MDATYIEYILIGLQNKFHEAVVNLTTQTIQYNVRLGPHMHAPGDGEEILALERIAIEDEGVQAEIAKLKLPEGTKIVVDPWIYGEHQRYTDVTSCIDRYRLRWHRRR